MDGAARSYQLLSERMSSIADALGSALDDDGPIAARSAFPKSDERLSIVGAGGSAGPARVLATCLNRMGWAARSTAPSTFIVSPPAGRCAVVSQGMSPNARLTLNHAAAERLVITASATARDDPRNVVVAHGPANESGMLVRVVGPTLATLAAMRFAGIATDAALGELPSAVASASITLPDQPFDHIVFVAAGAYEAFAHGLRWKLLETVGFGDPPVYGVLQFAHGPFQQFYERRVLVIVLDRGTPEEQPLFARLACMLVPSRHPVLRLRATLPDPLCWFEHDAMLNQLVLSLLRQTPRDLIEWPGKGRDAELYGLDR